MSQAATKTFKPSKYQQALFDFISTGTGNALVSAVAGSGKSTSLLKAINLIDSSNSVHYFAFNKTIASELKAKIPNSSYVSASTIHSFGMRAIIDTKKVKIDDRKYDILFDEMYVDGMESEGETKVDVKTRVMQIVQLSRVNLINTWDGALDMCDKYEINGTEQDCRLAMSMMNAGKKGFDTIDFTDMIWLPVVLKLRVQKFDYVFVDECQDLSEAQRSLVMMAVRNNGGRFVAVGDPHQSIYGFAGADVDSFNKFKTIPNTVELPLSVCYRCGSSIIELAKTIVPHIESVEGAKEGIVNDNAKVSDVKSGDMVLCRNTAPLVKLGFQYIAAGIRATIVGRDIGQNLITMVTKTKTNSITTMSNKLANELEKIEKSLIKKKGMTSQEAQSNSQYSSYKDKVDAISVISGDCSDTEEVISKIEMIFSDNEDKGIILSTVHKSKGLEADNVYIIHEELMPSKNAKTPWAKVQEKNLMYVAYTRAKNILGFITDFDAYSDKPTQIKKQENQRPVVKVGDVVSEELTIKEVKQMTTKFGITKKYVMSDSYGRIVVKLGSMNNSKIIKGKSLEVGCTVKVKASVKSVEVFNGREEINLGMLLGVE